MSTELAGTRTLITGGLGFIGAWTAMRIVREGGHVTLFDNAPAIGSPGHALGLASHPAVRVTYGDVRRSETFDALPHNYDYIVHAAAILGVNHVMQRPIDTLSVNIGGTENALSFATRQNRLQRFVLLSTSEVYGRDARDACEDDHVRLHTDSVRWGYAASKNAGEFFAHAYSAEFGVKVTIVRPFNVYGPLRRCDNVMTVFVSRALRGEPLHVLSSGTQTRSWCHITDFVSGLLGCMTSPKAAGETVNLGNDDAVISVRELAERVTSLCGSSSTIEVAMAGPPDVLRRNPCLHKARALFGYAPTVELDIGLRTLLRSFVENATRAGLTAASASQSARELSRPGSAASSAAELAERVPVIKPPASPPADVYTSRLDHGPT